MNKPKLNSRFSKIFMSTGTSIILKAFIFICSFVLTNLLITTYGSEINGMLGSITQFLSIITLLEGGICGICRAALYKPLLNHDEAKINKIITYSKRFFKIIALIFVGYALALAFVFPIFSKQYDFLFTFLLVVILALATFCEYFFGISYTVLLAADQKSYLNEIFYFIAVIINFLVSFLLIKAGLSIHIVKLCSAIIFMIKPVLIMLYCNKKYNIKKTQLLKNENVLPNKWDGIGINIAFYLHRSTDTILITIFLSLSVVSVYSVYNMIMTGILTISEALSLGSEAAFGDIYASGDINQLKSSFKKYSFYYSFISTIIFAATAVLIIPFVKLYTANVTDVNYIQPVFALIMLAGQYFYCLRVPYNNLMFATNSFKKNKWGAYIEAIINIVLSIILINFLGIVGVAIGTLCAMFFRLIHFLIFFKKHEINFEVGWFIKTSIINIIGLVISVILTSYLNIASPTSWGMWILYAIFVALFTFIIVTILSFLFNRKDTKDFILFISSKFFK